MVQLSNEDRAYNRLVRIFDKAGFEVWSPRGGHLNMDLSEAAGAEMADDSRAWGVRTSEMDDDLPLTAKITLRDGGNPETILARIKTSLGKRGFRVSEKPPILANGFSQLANGVVAKTVRDRVKGEELHIVISELPEQTL